MPHIPVNEIIPKRNNRQNFDHVPELAQSIAEHGLLQSVILQPIADNDPALGQETNFSFTIGDETRGIILRPRFYLIGGESRWRAHIWGNMPTIRAEIDEIATGDEIRAMLGTIIENVTRKELTPVEESKGYNTLLDLGLSVSDIAQKTGKKINYIEKRIKLKSLNKEYSELVHSGQLTIDYATSLCDLNPEYQYQAMTELVAAGDKATIAWFRKTCNRLLEKQSSVSLFDLALFGGQSSDNGLKQHAAALPVSTMQPVNPFNYVPNFDGKPMNEALLDAIATLEKSAIVWAEYEHTDKVSMCRNLITQYQTILDNLTPKPEQRIKRLLSERGEMTKRELAQYSNMPVSSVIDALRLLPVVELKTGKKTSYRLDC